MPVRSAGPHRTRTALLTAAVYDHRVRRRPKEVELTKQERTAQNLVGHLANQLTKGWKSYLIAKHLHTARIKNASVRLPYLFNVAEDSCLELAVLALAKLTDPHCDAASISYLLEYSEQNPGAFPRIGSQAIRDGVKRAKKQLEVIQPTIDEIQHQRSTRIAHLDKNHIKKPSVVRARAISDKEVENVFGLLHAIIQRYIGHVAMPGDIRLPTKELNKSIVAEFKYLTFLIENDSD